MQSRVPSYKTSSWFTVWGKLRTRSFHFSETSAPLAIPLETSTSVYAAHSGDIVLILCPFKKKTTNKQKTYEKTIENPEYSSLLRVFLSRLLLFLWLRRLTPRLISFVYFCSHYKIHHAVVATVDGNALKTGDKVTFFPSTWRVCQTRLVALHGFQAAPPQLTGHRRKRRFWRKKTTSGFYFQNKGIVAFNPQEPTFEVNSFKNAPCLSYSVTRPHVTRLHCV